MRTEDWAAEMAAAREGLRGDRHRPGYHFLPPRYWVNDPNGLIQHRGKYHLFYQHNPKAAVWGNMTWGHAISDDLVRWRDLPHAMEPVDGYDKDGVFSGCCVHGERGVPTIVYTGVRPQVQCLARPVDPTDTDLAAWQKHVANPVLAQPPEGYRRHGDFRDPYVWREADGSWRMVLGTQRDDGVGAVLLYRGRSLEEWEYVGPLIVDEQSSTIPPPGPKVDPCAGRVWECPNFFALGDKWVLIIHPLAITAVRWFVGTFDGARFRPEKQGFLDDGHSVSAPQAFLDEGGRRILIGWLAENRPAAEQVASGWSGAMTLPRELYLTKDGSVGSRLVAEVDALRGEEIVRSDWEQAGESLEVSATFGPEVDRPQVAVRRSPDDAERTEISYDRALGLLTVDRTRSSLNEQVQRDVRQTTMTLGRDEPLRLRVMVDRSVIEVFANERIAMTVRVYPTRDDAAGVRINHGQAAVYRIAPIW